MATKQVRLIQTGDWHMYANNATWTESGFRYRQSQLKVCLQQIFRAVNTADFLLLTGDLMDQLSNDNYLAWLEKEFSSIGREKLIAIYGSHDKSSHGKSVRDWFSSRTAWRKPLGPDVYAIESRTFNTVFYAIDSRPEESQRERISDNAINKILKARQKQHKSFSRAVLLVHIKEADYKAPARSLGPSLTYVAIGHHHSYRSLPCIQPPTVYSGAPVARDACTEGDDGPRHFLQIELDGDGHHTIRAVPLKAGGYQVSIKQAKEKPVTLSYGPGTANKLKLLPTSVRDFPHQVVERINEVTKDAWTSIAVQNQVQYRQALLDYLEQRYTDAKICSFCAKGSRMYYFFRKNAARKRQRTSN